MNTYAHRTFFRLMMTGIDDIVFDLTAGFKILEHLNGGTPVVEPFVNDTID
jgi:hypothetical protein